MMSDRDAATRSATTWAHRADQHASDYLDTSYAAYVTDPGQAVHVAYKRDQAERMALMWATIAALHPVEPVPSLGKRFFLGSTPAGRPHCGCAMWDQGIAHMAHDWYLVGGPRVHCNGAPPDAKVPCGYCGCTDDPAHCTCAHEGTGATADQLPPEGRICTASFTVPEHELGAGTTYRCALAAGHYKPGRDVLDSRHRDRPEGEGGGMAMTWFDWAGGVLPHGNSTGSSDGPCGSRFTAGTTQTCYLPKGHGGLHRGGGKSGWATGAADPEPPEGSSGAAPS